jgi:hypothetical protein
MGRLKVRNYLGGISFRTEFPEQRAERYDNHDAEFYEECRVYGCPGGAVDSALASHFAKSNRKHGGAERVARGGSHMKILKKKLLFAFIFPAWQIRDTGAFQGRLELLRFLYLNRG